MKTSGNQVDSTGSFLLGVILLATWLLPAAGADPSRASGPSGAPSFDLRFDEPAGRAAGPVRWPVTVGVPFANGAVSADTPVALKDAAGNPIPVQTQVLGQWRGAAPTPPT